MKLVNKLSVKAVVGNPPTKDVRVPKMANGTPVVGKDGEVEYETVQRGIKQNVMRVYGQCDKIKLGNTSFGETVEFIGNFEATNMLDGEIYRSTRLFMPPTVTEMVKIEVETVLKNKAEGDTSGAAVQFAFDIGIDSANNAHGYQYTITPLTSPSTSDPLALMKASLLKDAPPILIENKVEATTAETDEAAEKPAKAKK